MTYPTNITEYPIKIDKNASGVAVTGEYFNIPASSPYQMYLDHVPKDSATTQIYASGGAEWTEDTTGTPSAGEFYINYTVGRAYFNAANAGAALEARYQTLGDDIMAEHINSMQDEVYGVETELGLGCKGVYATLSQRLGSFVTTSDTISAELVTCDPPLGATFYTVQDHIDSIGTVANLSDENPHGLGWQDLFDTDGSMYRAQNNISIANLFASAVVASGNYMTINYGGADRDQFIYFSDSGATIGYEWLKWDEGDTRFELSNDTMVQGDITASGNIMPDASGTRDIGSVATAWNDAYIDKVYLESNPTTPLQAATKQYVDNAVEVENLWDRAGTTLAPHYAGDNVEAVAFDIPTKKVTVTDFTAAGINDAIDALGADGGEVYLPEGTYVCTDTAIVIDAANTTLTGSGKGTILDWSAGQNTTTGCIDTNTLDYITIRNMTLLGSAGGGDTTALIGDYDDADYLIIRDCYFINADADAIATTGDYIHIVDNYFDNSDNDDMNLISDYSVVTNNTSVNCGSRGVMIQGTGDVIANNVIKDVGMGIRCDATNSQITGNIIKRSANWSGIQVIGNYVVVDSNYITDAPNGYAEILVNGNYCVVSNNICYGDGASNWGIKADDADYCVITGNTTDNHDVAGIQEDADCQNNSIFGNRCEDATPYILNGVDRSTTAASHILPAASGVIDLGSLAFAFDDAYIDKVYLEANPTTPLQAATKQYVDDQDAAADAHIISDGTSHANVVLNDAHRLDNSQAHSDYLINTGDTIAGNLDPEASGTRNLGTVALAFNDAHIDKVYLEADPTTGLEAATKNYVDTQIAAVIALIP